MQYHRIPHTALEVSELGLGTMNGSPLSEGRRTSRDISRRNQSRYAKAMRRWPATNEIAFHTPQPPCHPVAAAAIIGNHKPFNNEKKTLS